jgi:Mce-associated membrane protein
VEDQQSHPGDLTDESPDESSADAEVESLAEPGPDEGDENDDAASSPDDEAAASAADDDAGPRAKRRTGRRLAAVAGASVALFVGSAAFAGAAVQPYLADRALVATKVEIVRTAVNAINALWNYTPDNMATLADRASRYLSGDLEAGYRKFIDQIVETNKQAKVTDSTEIAGAALESLDGREATVMVYTNTTATSELSKTIPSLKYQSYRLFMRRDHNRWVVTKMPTITSLSLTPRL